MSGLDSRNIVFGVQDSVVTTIGLMAGVSLSDVPRSDVVRFVLVSVLVSSFSMAIGSYQSERASQAASSQPDRAAMLRGAAIMFFAYLLTGIALMTPYIFSQSQNIVLLGATCIAVLLLGVVGRRTAGSTNPSRNMLETVALGLLALGLGFVSGKISQTFIQPSP